MQPATHLNSLSFQDLSFGNMPYEQHMVNYFNETQPGLPVLDSTKLTMSNFQSRPSVTQSVQSNMSNFPHIADASESRFQHFSNPATQNAKPAQPPPPCLVTIENTCLSYIRSQLLRLDQAEVISSTCTHFVWDEIRAARELLSRSTGQPLYKYQGPHDTNLRPKQCVASIIGKIQDLYKDKQPVNYVNSATDLFRLASMLVKPGGMEKSTDYNSVDMRLHRIEMDLKYLKTSSLNQNPAAIPAPRFKPGSNTTNRQNLLKTLSSPSPSSMDSPSKRLRSGEPVIHSD